MEVGGCCQVYQLHNCSTLLALVSGTLISTFLLAPKFCATFIIFFSFPSCFAFLYLSKNTAGWKWRHILNLGAFLRFDMHISASDTDYYVWKRLLSRSAITSHLIILLYLLPVAHPSHAGPSLSASALLLSRILTSLVCFFDTELLLTVFFFLSSLCLSLPSEDHKYIIAGKCTKPLPALRRSANTWLPFTSYEAFMQASLERQSTRQRARRSMPHTDMHT